MTTQHSLPSAGLAGLDGGLGAFESRNNTTPLAELLSRAKAAIETGYDPGGKLPRLWPRPKSSTTLPKLEMAGAVGKSEAWISQLLSWRRSGYKRESPFGPTTKAGRLQHAKALAAVGASKRPRSRKASTKSPEAACAEERVASNEKVEVEIARATGTDGATLLRQFKAAVGPLSRQVGLAGARGGLSTRQAKNDTASRSKKQSN